jgi:hypothetical protein
VRDVRPQGPRPARRHEVARRRPAAGIAPFLGRGTGDGGDRGCHRHEARRRCRRCRAGRGRSGRDDQLRRVLPEAPGVRRRIRKGTRATGCGGGRSRPRSSYTARGGRSAVQPRGGPSGPGSRGVHAAGHETRGRHGESTRNARAVEWPGGEGARVAAAVARPGGEGARKSDPFAGPRREGARAAREAAQDAAGAPSGPAGARPQHGQPAAGPGREAAQAVVACIPLRR